MDSVSMAARDSFRVTVDSCVSSHARSAAVRSAHLPATRTRLTPRVSYSLCNCVSKACTSASSGNRFAKIFSSSGASAANSNASRMRNSSARSCCCVLSTTTLISAACGMQSSSLLPIPHFDGYAAFSRMLTLTHVKWCKRCVLIQLNLAFTHQFERRGKSRGQYGGSQGRLDQIFREILIERTPLERHADQPFQCFARFGERPHRTLRHSDHRP